MTPHEKLVDDRERVRGMVRRMKSRELTMGHTPDGVTMVDATPEIIEALEDLERRLTEELERISS